jgi:hypothetical protein
VSLPNDAVAGMTAANGFIYAATINTTVVPPAPAGAIARVQLSSSTVDQTYIPSLSFPSGVAVDGTHVYWVDRGPMVNTIGRAVLGTSGATDVQPSFISEPGGPTDVAVDGGIDPTTTSVTCNPASVAKGNPTTCTATVHDAASSTPPTGTVNVTGDATTFFQGNPCQLTPLAAGGGSSCVVGADPTNAGTQTITAAYGGDAVHEASSGTLALCAGTTDPCGSTAPPPPPKPNCVVPKLKGKSLTTARKLLHKAHCTLGKVKRPRHSRHHHLVVGSQSPRAGKRLANDAKVNVKLVRAHRH